MAKPRKLYIRVGLLLLAGIILAIGFVLFLTAGRLSKTAEIAETYFSESVTGLEVGAPVRYRGVRVGQVAEIGLVNAEYRPDSRSQAAVAFQLVLVRLAIDPARATMQTAADMQRAVESGLRARLASAGITGGSYVELDFVDPARFPPREVPWQPAHQVIPSMPSTVAQVQNAAEQLLTRVQDAPIEEILNNVASLTGALSGQAGKDGELARTIREAAETMTALRQIVSGPELSGTLKELREVAANLNALTGGSEARRTLASISGAADGLRTAMARLPGAIESLERTSRAARGVTQDTNADLAPLLRDLRAVASNLRDTTELLRRAPGQAILGAPPPPPNR